MANGILVLIENRNGKIKKGSLEALSTASRLGLTTGAVVFGSCDTAQLARYGAARIHQVSLEMNGQPREALIASMEAVIRQADPEYVFASATAMGKDLLPAVASRFGASVAQDVTDIRSEGGDLHFRRPIYAGKAFETVKAARRPAFATLRPNVFEMAECSGAGETCAVAPAAPACAGRSLLREVREMASGKVELTEAAIVVSGGRGIKAPENYKMVEELASVLDAAAGASRAVVDAGWVDHSHQVGQTGKTVSPTLYVALGISGAIQHMAGMSSSKYIVAVNKDPDAPIFKVANYGIVGDLFTVAPLLIAEIKKARNL